MDEHGVKDVDEAGIDEEGFEEEGHDGGALAEHEHRAVEPGQPALEERQEGHLREVGPHEEVREDEEGEEQAEEQPGAEERVEEGVGEEVVDALMRVERGEGGDG